MIMGSRPLKAMLGVAVVLACISCPAPLSPVGARAMSGGPSIQVKPALVREFVKLGRSMRYTLVVSNTGSCAVDVEACVRDLALSRQGFNVFLRPGEPGYAWGAGTFLTVDESRFTLAPGQERNLTVKAEIPAWVRGSRYGAVLFKGKAAGARSSIMLSVETGTLFAFTAENTLIYRGNLNLRGIEDGRVLAEFVNTGNSHITAGLAAEILDSHGRPVASGSMAGGTGTVLPGGVREYAWEVPRGLPDGSYRLRVTASYDGRRAGLTRELQVVHGALRLGKAIDGEEGAL